MRSDVVVGGVISVVVIIDHGSPHCSSFPPTASHPSVTPNEGRTVAKTGHEMQEMIADVRETFHDLQNIKICCPKKERITY